MDITTAKNLLNNIAKIWRDGDTALIGKFYAADFRANYYGNHIVFDDLISRADYMKIHHKNHKLDILDIVSEANKIAARCYYSAIDDQEGAISSEFLVIYHLDDNNRIQKAWAFAEKDFSYRI